MLQSSTLHAAQCSLIATALGLTRRTQHWPCHRLPRQHTACRLPSRRVPVLVKASSLPDTIRSKLYDSLDEEEDPLLDEDEDLFEDDDLLGDEQVEVEDEPGMPSTSDPGKHACAHYFLLARRLLEHCLGCQNCFTHNLKQSEQLDMTSTGRTSVWNLLRLPQLYCCVYALENW